LDGINIDTLAAQIADAFEDKINKRLDAAFQMGYEKGLKDGAAPEKAGGMTNWEKLKETFGDTFIIPYPGTWTGFVGFRERLMDAVEWAYQVYEEPKGGMMQ